METEVAEARNMDLRKTLIEAIAEEQQLAGEEAVQIDLKTRPFEDLNGFDSLRAISVMVRLETVFGKRIEFTGEPFTGLTKNPSPTLEDIADALSHSLHPEISK